MFARRSEPFSMAPLEPFDLLGRHLSRNGGEGQTHHQGTAVGHDALAAFEALRYTPEFFRRYLDRYLTTRVGLGCGPGHTQTHIFESADFPGSGEPIDTEQHVLRMLAGAYRSARA